MKPGITVEVGLKLDAQALIAWNPEKLDAVMAGIARVLAATGEGTRARLTVECTDSQEAAAGASLLAQD